MSKVQDYCNSKGWRFRENGTQLILDDCPIDNCGKNHFYINAEHGAWDCKKCLRKGSFYDLQREMGDTLQPFKIGKPKVRPAPKEYSCDLDKWHDDLLNNEPSMERLRWRGFRTATIQHFKLALNAGKAGFPYFDGGTLTFIKWRTKDKKFFTEPKEVAFKNFYNIDGVNMSEPLLIVEGEFDAMAAWQMGFTNVISLPFGAGSFKQEYVEILVPAKKIYIITDNDEAGEKAANDIVSKIGRARCYRVYLPYKDMNDCLMNGMESAQIQECLDSAKHYRDENLIHLIEYCETFRTNLRNPEKQQGIKTGWSKFDAMLAGVRPGEVTVITGNTAVGKSTFCINLLYRVIKSGTIIISTEISLDDVFRKLYSIHSQMPINENTTDEALDLCDAYVGKHNVFALNVHGAVPIEKLQDHLEYAAKYNVKVAFLDHLHFFLPGKNTNTDQYEIANFMRQIICIARSTNIHIFLVVHPTKVPIDKDGVPDVVEPMHLKGSSTIMQDAHNIFSLWRNPSDEFGYTILHIKKVRSDYGYTGKVSFKFNRVAKEYIEM